jgi:hypothetical protein
MMDMNEDYEFRERRNENMERALLILQLLHFSIPCMNSSDQTSPWSSATSLLLSCVTFGNGAFILLLRFDARVSWVWIALRLLLLDLLFKKWKGLLSIFYARESFSLLACIRFLLGYQNGVLVLGRREARNLQMRNTRLQFDPPRRTCGYWPGRGEWKKEI